MINLWTFCKRVNSYRCSQVVGVDPVGSVIAKTDYLNKTVKTVYEVEGIGQKFVPTVCDRSVSHLLATLFALKVQVSHIFKTNLAGRHEKEEDLFSTAK